MLGRPPEYGRRIRTERGIVVSLLRQFCLAPGLLLGERDHFGEARFAAKVAVIDPTHCRRKTAGRGSESAGQCSPPHATRSREAFSRGPELVSVSQRSRANAS